MRLPIKSLTATSALCLMLTACSGGDAPETTATASNTPKEGTEASTPPVSDPRAGLKAGFENPGEAIWNLAHEVLVGMPPGFTDENALWSPQVEFELARKLRAGEQVDRQPSPISYANSDLAFTGNRVIMGNFHGMNVIEFNEGKDPEIVLSLVCPGGQGDVSVHGDLVFHSVEQPRGRIDCGSDGVQERSSSERFRGVRIFDLSDIKNPKQVAAVQTCRGSHTHTLVPHPSDENLIYIYVSGTSSVRLASELEGCTSGEPENNPDTALYRIDIIEVPLDAPQNARVINSPRIFSDKVTGAINGLWKGGELEEGAQRSSKTTACHDITVYPAYNLAAGACSGNGILMDIKDPANPKRIAEISDPNFAYWHSATFSNDAKKVLFTDEWGGGLGARCRPKDPEKWGANIVTHITQNGFEPKGFFKIPGVQSDTENCVAHNGTLVPVPGRDIMVQGWYSGGLSVIDFTDSSKPFEIAFFDRGPLSEEYLYLAGYWAAYWHNGRIYAPEIVRGLDVFSLNASDHLSAAEIEAASLIQFEQANTQTQEKLVWPDHPAVAQAYLDQLKRSGNIDAGFISRASKAVIAWRSGDVSGLEGLSGEAAGQASAAKKTDAKRLKALAGMFGRQG